MPPNEKTFSAAFTVSENTLRSWVSAYADLWSSAPAQKLASQMRQTFVHEPTNHSGDDRNECVLDGCYCMIGGRLPWEFYFVHRPIFVCVCVCVCVCVYIHTHTHLSHASNSSCKIVLKYIYISKNLSWWGRMCIYVSKCICIAFLTYQVTSKLGC